MKNKKTLVRTLCQVAMLIALEIVLDRFCSITTPVTRIGFAFIPMALCGMLFGPIWAGAAYAVADLLAAFEHQPAVIGLEAVEEDAPRPGMAEGGVFDLQHGIEIRLGHRAEGNCIAHWA